VNSVHSVMIDAGERVRLRVAVPLSVAVPAIERSERGNASPLVPCDGTAVYA
jgi:hypothetical protein